MRFEPYLLTAAFAAWAHVTAHELKPGEPAPLAGPPEPNRSLYAAQYLIKELQKNINVDMNEPMYYDTEELREGACLEYWGLCPSVGFFYRGTLFNVTKREIVWTVNSDARTTNDGTDNNTIRTQYSTSDMRLQSTGWKVGATIRAGRSDSDPFGVTVSAEYGETTTHQETITRTKDFSMICRPDYYCSLETWTFFLKISGTCVYYPYVYCYGKRNMCNPNENPGRPWPQNWQGCAQFRNFREGGCPASGPPVTDNCTFTVPLHEANGNLVTLMVSSARKLLGKPHERRRARARARRISG